MAIWRHLYTIFDLFGGPKMTENGQKWAENGPKISQKMGLDQV